MTKLLLEIMKDGNCENYTAYSGKNCYRIYGDLDYYFWKCGQYGLRPKMDGDFCYTAKGDGFEFEYIEHTIIYAEDLKL